MSEENFYNKPIQASNLYWLIIVIILIASNVYFYVRCRTYLTKINENTNAVISQKINSKVIDFTKIFINDVLKADHEVNFETRLKLENSVRGLEDIEILDMWQKFIESKTESEAQIAVKNLLGLLINKIEIK